jgi:molybdopterin/thiamine biosynthesis adenylyltransferase
VKTEKEPLLPIIFHENSVVDNAAFKDLIGQRNPLLLDTMEDQLQDLAACQYPELYSTGASLPTLVEKTLNGRKIEQIANWVYYPWKNTAVRVLNEEDFILCRTNRNKLKITDEQQNALRQKQVLFIGLSVGQSAALTFAMQRLCGHFHLADFDTLSLSNLNRLRASITDIGLEKTVIAARQITEQDPYLKVTCYQNGVTADNIDNMLTLNGTGKVDLVVEECDGLEMKFLIRERARHFGIPVIMETSDRGVVDIERFDLEPNRSILHGLAGNLSFEEVKDFDRGQRIDLLTKIVDYANISDGLKKSYAALGKEVLTWPQLGYEVTLGGASLAYAAGIILLGKSMKSGRFYVDLDTFFKQHLES